MLKLFKRPAYSSSNGKSLCQSVKNIFGFKPGNAHLYKLAFRHKSTRVDVNGIKINNERLEYLGDAVLSSVVADYLFKKFPYKGEGFLTEMRSKIVCRSNLEKLALKLGFQKLMETSSDTRGPVKSMLGDAFEAFVGALYLDKGYDDAKEIIINNIIGIHMDIDALEHLDTNFKSKLIEWAQKEKRHVEFIVVAERGEKGNRQYEVEVILDGKSAASGIDFSIKGAEKIAAEKACRAIIPE